MSLFRIYKRGQGRYTRSVTFLAVMLIVVIGARTLSNKLAAYAGPYVQFGVPTLLVIALGVLMFWLVNRVKSADFLITTEGEMKKVSWSSKKEVIGSTKVVIVTTLIMAAVLGALDVAFTLLFQWLGVMG